MAPKRRILMIFVVVVVVFVLFSFVFYLFFGRVFFNFLGIYTHNFVKNDSKLESKGLFHAKFYGKKFISKKIVYRPQNCDIWGLEPKNYHFSATEDSLW